MLTRVSSSSHASFAPVFALRVSESHVLLIQADPVDGLRILAIAFEDSDSLEPAPDFLLDWDDETDYDIDDELDGDDDFDDFDDDDDDDDDDDFDDDDDDDFDDDDDDFDEDDDDFDDDLDIDVDEDEEF